MRLSGLHYHGHAAQARITTLNWQEERAGKAFTCPVVVSGWISPVRLSRWACGDCPAGSWEVLQVCFAGCEYRNIAVSSAARIAAGTVLLDQCPKGVSSCLVLPPLPSCRARGSPDTHSSSCQQIVLVSGFSHSLFCLYCLFLFYISLS